VASMAQYFFKHHGHSEKHAATRFDNCCGQKKIRSRSRYIQNPTFKKFKYNLFNTTVLIIKISSIRVNIIFKNILNTVIIFFNSIRNVGNNTYLKEKKFVWLFKFYFTNTGLHESVELSTMITGHTKFDPYWHIGL